MDLLHLVFDLTLGEWSSIWPRGRVPESFGYIPLVNHVASLSVIAQMRIAAKNPYFTLDHDLVLRSKVDGMFKGLIRFGCIKDVVNVITSTLTNDICRVLSEEEQICLRDILIKLKPNSPRDLGIAAETSSFLDLRKIYRHAHFDVGASEYFPIKVPVSMLSPPVEFPRPHAPYPTLPPPVPAKPISPGFSPLIRGAWRVGGLLGSGAYARVYEVQPCDNTLIAGTSTSLCAKIIRYKLQSVASALDEIKVCVCVCVCV